MWLEVIIILKEFYLSYGYQVKECQRTIDELNQTLEPVGVHFRAVEKLDPNDHSRMFKSLFIDIDDDKVSRISNRKKSGRPPEHEFDYEKIKEMRANGMKNKDICTELNISTSLFYTRMREYKKIIVDQEQRGRTIQIQ